MWFSYIVVVWDWVLPWLSATLWQLDCIVTHCSYCSLALNHWYDISWCLYMCGHWVYVDMSVAHPRTPEKNNFDYVLKCAAKVSDIYGISHKMCTWCLVILFVCGYQCWEYISPFWWIHIIHLPLSIKINSLAQEQLDDCPSFTKVTLMNMDEKQPWSIHKKF